MKNKKIGDYDEDYHIPFKIFGSQLSKYPIDD